MATKSVDSTDTEDEDNEDGLKVIKNDKLHPEMFFDMGEESAEKIIKKNPETKSEKLFKVKVRSK